ncbi:hypothetical protein LXA43DRAFT_1063075 [Ganoderma leucocontextum]|nr:hypothetical protein LXA43DRAFT_1063075 [Ganoderma leucocontextum]
MLESLGARAGSSVYLVSGSPLCIFELGRPRPAPSQSRLGKCSHACTRHRLDSAPSTKDLPFAVTLCSPRSPVPLSQPFNHMEPIETTTPCSALEPYKLRRVIQLKLIDGRVRVVEEESVKKAVAHRHQLGVDLESATVQFTHLLRRYNEGDLNVPQDVQDLIVLCHSYRVESLRHNYQSALLVEYILHLHLMHGAQGPMESLPPIPPEITWYVDTDRSED